MPAMPEAPAEGIIRGMYRYRRPAGSKARTARRHLFGSGAIMTEVLRAPRAARGARHRGRCLECHQLQRTVSRSPARRAREPAGRGHRGASAGTLCAGRLLADETGVFVAASDYMKALPLSIARWVPGPYVVLGHGRLRAQRIPAGPARLVRGQRGIHRLGRAGGLGGARSGHRGRSGTGDAGLGHRSRQAGPGDCRTGGRAGPVWGLALSGGR